MSITTKAVRDQLTSLAQTIADAHNLELFTDSLFSDQFKKSGIYLHSTFEQSLTLSGTTLAKISGSVYTFFISVVVHHQDFGFDGPEGDMPDRMADVADTIVTEIMALNVANQDSQTKIRISFPEANFVDYKYETHQGVAQFPIGVLYSNLRA